MSSEFIRTQLTILRRLAVEKTGEDEATWARFFELYYPAMVAFATHIGAKESAEDVVQDVLVKLVDVLKHGRYDRRPCVSFHSYVKAMIRNTLNDLYRREKARGAGLKVELNEAIVEDMESSDPGVGELLDEQWAWSCYESAVRHVLEKSAMSPQSKAVYRAYVLDERPLDEVAKEFGVSKNMVSQIKTRVERMVSAKLAEFGD